MTRIVLGILVFLSHCVAGQSHSLFWQVKHPRSKDTSYLFGTIHLISADKFHVPATVEHALLASEICFFESEFNVSNIDIVSLTTHPTKRLTDYLTSPEIDSLLTYSETILNADSATFYDQYNSLKPFVFSQMDKNDQTPKMSYDLHLMGLAKKNKRPIKGLETLPEQMQFFDEMPDSLQKYLIQITYRQIGQNNTNEELDLEDSYLSQNWEKIRAEYEKEDALSQFLKNRLLIQRNQEWVTKLHPQLRKKPCFVAVGAAHLTGEFGLVALLREKGYELTPIIVNLRP